MVEQISGGPLWFPLLLRACGVAVGTNVPLLVMSGFALVWLLGCLLAAGRHLRTNSAPSPAMG